MRLILNAVMTKSKKLPRYKQILALGDTSNLTAAEIADKLGLCQTDVTVAIYHAEKYHSIAIPYRKIYSGGKRAGAECKPKPPVAAKKAPQKKDSGKGGKEPIARDCRRCKGCRYWRSLSTTSESTMKACHYCYDTGHRRGCPAGSGCTRREP